MQPKAERKPRANKKQTINAVEPVKIVIVEPVEVKPVEVKPVEDEPVEDEPVFSDDEEEPQNEIIDSVEDVKEEEEDGEDSDEEIEAQIRALQKKKLEKDIKKNIINIRKFISDGMKIELENKEKQLKNILLEIESIKQSIADIDEGLNDDLLIKAEIIKKEQPQTIKAVKKDKPQKKEGVRVSTDMKRPKNLASCFKRETIIHHNKGGNNEYAMVYAVNGRVHRCNNEMKEIGEGYETINAFTNDNYKRKNERDGTNRTLRNNAYVECLYKNDAGIWCCCDDLRDGKTLTER